MSNAEDGYLGDWLPHKETCRCIDCELERATTQIRTLRAQFAAAQAELSRVREWWSVAYDGEVQAGEKLFAAFNKMRNELCDAQAKLDEALCANELDRRSLHAVFRESDGWEMTSGFSYGTDRVQTFIKYMKERVDNYILHPEEESE